MAPFISENKVKQIIDNSVCATITALATNSSNSANITTLAPIPSDNLDVACILAVSVLWFGYFFFDKQKAKDGTGSQAKDLNLKQIFNPNTSSPGHPVDAVLLYILMFVWIYVACISGFCL